MNKRIIVTIFCITTLFTLFTSCSNDQFDQLDVVDNLNISHNYSNEVLIYQDIYSLSLSSIYTEAFDGENIDEQKALLIFEYFAKDIANIDININSVHSNYLRSSEYYSDFEKIVADNFTTKGTEILKQLGDVETLDIEKINELRNEALILSNDESQIIVDIIDLVSVSITEIDKYLHDSNSSFFRGSENKSKFPCNLASSMVGGVVGFLSGVVTGPAGGIVGPIVGGVVSAYISTKAC